MIKMVKMSILDWVTFGVLFGIFVWLVLKTFGVINTPEWLLYAPLYGAIFAAGSFYYKMIGVSNKVVKLEGFVERFKSATVEKIHNLEINCTRNHG